MISKRDPNALKIGVSPVLLARLWDFDTAVVAILCQPCYGGKNVLVQPRLRAQQRRTVG
jgi:hypothetical protein